MEPKPLANLLSQLTFPTYFPNLRTRYLTWLKVEPKAGEEKEANFPRNLHNAAELLVGTGHQAACKLVS